MSWQATTAVTKYSKAKGSARLVMLCLANYAGAEGDRIWPAINPTLMRDTLLGERALRYILRGLEAIGELRVDIGAGPNGCNKYVILLPIDGVEVLACTAGGKDINGSTGGGGKDCRGAKIAGAKSSIEGGNTVPPNNHLIEEQPLSTKRRSRSQGSHVSSPKKFDADPRHKAFKEIVIHVHSCANGMDRELVPWDGREGTALAGLLKEKPAMTEEHAKRCVKNFYNSDTDIAARPGGKAGVIRRMLEFWHEKNQFGTPRFMDKDWVKQQRMHSEASVGSYHGE